MSMTPEDLRDLLEQARASLSETIGYLETYVRETDDRYAQAYLVEQLAVHLEGHGLLSDELTIDKLIAQLGESGDEEE